MIQVAFRALQAVVLLLGLYMFVYYLSVMVCLCVLINFHVMLVRLSLVK